MADSCANRSKTKITIKGKCENNTIVQICLYHSLCGSIVRFRFCSSNGVHSVFSLVSLLQGWLHHCGSHCYCFEGLNDYFCNENKEIDNAYSCICGLIPVGSKWVMVSDALCVVYDIFMIDFFVCICIIKYPN